MLRRRQWPVDGLLGLVLAAPVAGNQTMDGRYGWAAVAGLAVIAAVVSARR